MVFLKICVFSIFIEFGCNCCLMDYLWHSSFVHRSSLARYQLFMVCGTNWMILKADNSCIARSIDSGNTKHMESAKQ